MTQHDDVAYLARMLEMAHAAINMTPNLFIRPKLAELEIVH
jgi:hypothetical protein